MRDYYKFIKPVANSPRKPMIATGAESHEAIDWLITQSPEYVHFDLETTGLNYADPKNIVTNIGLASPDWLVGIDLMDVPVEDQKKLWDWMRQQCLGGFNLGFDLAWPWRIPEKDGRVRQDIEDINVHHDTSLWFRLLATESHFNQRHDLDTLVATVLGWSPRYQQKAWLKSALSKYEIKKEHMWKLALCEPYKYTEYCALDAEASYQAHDVFQNTLKEWDFTGLNDYHHQVLVPKIKRNIVQTSRGIPVDRDLLKSNMDMVQKRIAMLEAKALAHPKVSEHLQEYVQAKLEKQYELKPSLKKVWAKSTDEPWKYPEVWRLEHIEDPEKIAKLPKWCREFQGKFYKAETKFDIKGKNIEWPRFNVGSTRDMKWLIYDKWLQGSYKVWYRIKDNPQAGGLVIVTVDGKDYELELTQGGGLPTGGDIMTLFGEVGKIFNEYKGLQKLYGDFLSKYELASRRTGYIHPQTKILGTATGRASGGN